MNEILSHKKAQTQEHKRHKISFQLVVLFVSSSLCFLWLESGS